MNNMSKIPRRIQEQIANRIEQNAVTIIVGPTGCGKSTQVPSILEQLTGGPILCTQPRRLAVTAVALRVAEERQTELGGYNVGYQIGQDCQRRPDTRIVFTTAGYFLEELRAKGIALVDHYKVIVLDECHERSPESDLVLALMRTLLKLYPRNRIRLVLMSATFDHERYRNYFLGLNAECEFIDTIQLESAQTWTSYYDKVETKYLRSIVTSIGNNLQHHHAEWLDTMKYEPDADIEKGRLSEGCLAFVQDLLEHLDGVENEQGTFLCFAPTYRYLEQLYQQMQQSTVDFQLGVLHSSVDMDHLLSSMKASRSRGRKVLFASAIADSSVTIPGVVCVIDLCRSLEVKWDADNEKNSSQIVWTSKSICDQRRGRTGRTCSGTVYRLVEERFYNETFQEFETPQITLSSCRNECLRLLSTGRAIKGAGDPAYILNECMDSPNYEYTKRAMEFLSEVGASEVTSKTRVSSTPLGELLAALPFNIEDGLLIVKGARLGLLYEVLPLVTITTTQPGTIKHYFAENNKNRELRKEYYPGCRPFSFDEKIAQFAAYVYWDNQWNGLRNLAASKDFALATRGKYVKLDDESEWDGSTALASLKRFWLAARSGDMKFEKVSKFLCPVAEHVDESLDDCGAWQWTPVLDSKHIKWCVEHEINPTGVRSINETVYQTLRILYNAPEPEWMRSTYPTPAWRRRQYDPKNKCLLSAVYGSQLRYLSLALTALCDEKNDSAAAGYAALFRGDSEQQEVLTSREYIASTPDRYACVMFLQGRCRFGDGCRYQHSRLAPRPPCQKFALGRCRNRNCQFRHHVELPPVVPGTPTVKDLMKSVAPIRYAGASGSVILNWLKNHKETLMLLGEETYEFTNAIVKMGFVPRFSSSFESPRVSQVGLTSLYQVDATRIHLNQAVREHICRGELTHFVFNFPHNGRDGDDSGNESLMLGIFLSLADLLLTTRDPVEFWFAMTLHRNQFSRWNVLRSATRTGWNFDSCYDFDKALFPGYTPKREGGSPMAGTDARFYLFVLPRLLPEKPNVETRRMHGRYAYRE